MRAFRAATTFLAMIAVLPGAAVLASAVSGCRSGQPSAESREEAPAGDDQARSIRFDCDTLAVTATFHDEQVVLEFPDRRVTLPRAPSASGARFANDSVAFWNKGREATLDANGRTETCRERREPWQDAADRGVEFRAVGEEPGWFLEIDRVRGFRLVYDYAEHEMTFPPAAPMTDGRVTTYEAMKGKHHIHVAVEDQACHDVLSGEAFPATVSVMLDSRKLKGCGRELKGR